MTSTSSSGKLVMVSGGMDPLHIGHLRYLEAAIAAEQIALSASANAN